MDFDDERRAVALRMAVGVAVTAALGVAIWLAPAPAILEDSLEARLRLAALAMCLPGAVVALQVGLIARKRFNSAESIAGAAGDQPRSPLTDDKAVLANHVEQAAIALPTYFLLALVLPAEQLLLLPGLALLYAVGRLLFAINYRPGAARRALGFALTFYPTLAALALGVALAFV